MALPQMTLKQRAAALEKARVVQDLQKIVSASASAFTSLFGPLAYQALQNELANSGNSFTISISVVDSYSGFRGSLLSSPTRVSLG